MEYMNKSIEELHELLKNNQTINQLLDRDINGRRI